MVPSLLESQWGLLFSFRPVRTGQCQGTHLESNAEINGGLCLLLPLRSRVHRAGRQAGLAPAGQPRLPPHPLPAGFSLCLCKVSPDVDWTLQLGNIASCFQKKNRTFTFQSFFFFLTNSQKGMSTKMMMLIYSPRNIQRLG